MKKITFKQLTKNLGSFVSVENAPSRNGYNKAPNQFIFRFENGTLFQSYQTPVAAFVGRQLYLSIEHDCSATTSRFVKQYTNLSKAERNKGLENGDIVLFEN